MDFCLNWKRPYSTTLWDVRNCSGIVDRLSSLPDELLLQILSLLPTKDAVVMCMLSRRMRLVFPSISSLDFDDSPISFCLKNPYGTEHFPKFVSFVFNAIRAYQSKYLNRFRLRVGRDFVTRSFSGCNTDGRCGEFCFPDLKFPLLNNLICVPLARCGLRELDLCIQVRIPGEIQLPSEIFTCETLEVLKLDVNLGLDQVSTLPSFRLPNLKLFHFCASVLPRTDFLLSGDGFLTKLISSCPLLEDFTVQAWWNYLHPAIISSPSLRRLCLKMHQIDSEQMNSFVDILTPNLEHLEYYGNLASHYSVSNMLCLVKADINIGDNLGDQEIEVSFQKTLSLIRPLSIVRKLSLVGSCVQNLDLVEVKNQLPMFQNLKYLELGYQKFSYWDKVLLAFLNCSPILETLVFPQGLICEGKKGLISEGKNDTEDSERLELEREFCGTTQAIPSCCRSHLKRIVIKKYMVKERELNLIQFMLRHALVLEELVIYIHRFPWRTWPPIEDRMLSLEKILKNLPRASMTCSIQVQ